ncbi:MAG: D-alanyl-D-alanine carboxypeptidase/D-alanyl-D-alanine-endopeptidase [Deltaproteobacteria bacterium]|nr:D-alanyl-D-alanine carboxypeptidase/D-alanyl-D-alanine-endopeptidase [Deltaproteobacteria bacterium]
MKRALSILRIFLVGSLFLAPGTGLRAAEEPANKPPVPLLAIEYVPLTQVLKQALTNPALAGALVGAKVLSLTSGRTLFAHNPDQLINPASVTKMYTTAAALSLLHPSHRFKTEIYTLKEPKRGVVKGPLYIKGYGDPFLVNERLTYLAEELSAMGIKKIDGPIILDDTSFDEENEGPGWAQDNSSRPYQAPMGALSLNFNSVAVRIFPGEKIGAPAVVEPLPESNHFKVENKVITGRRTRGLRGETSGLGRKTRIKLRGQIALNHPGLRYHLRVHQPTWYTGESFRMALKRAGIKVRKYIRRGKVPSYADLLYTLRSPALGELVRKVNKRSQNFMAEQLLKALGAAYYGEPASWTKGQKVMVRFLDEEVGIKPGTYVLHNGSGLNDVNRVTANQTCALLKTMWSRFDVRPDFLSSLAVAGSDGTVRRRFGQPGLQRTMRLKTGSLSGTRALAGYVHTRGNETFVFAITVARYKGKSYEINRVLDRFASALARSNADHQVLRETEVEPVPGPLEISTSDEAPFIVPEDATEGNEETDIPMGEP